MKGQILSVGETSHPPPGGMSGVNDAHRERCPRRPTSGPDLLAPPNEPPLGEDDHPCKLIRTGTETREPTTCHRGSWASVAIQAMYATSPPIVGRACANNAAGALRPEFNDSDPQDHSGARHPTLAIITRAITDEATKDDAPATTEATQQRLTRLLASPQSTASGRLDTTSNRAA